MTIKNIVIYTITISAYLAVTLAMSSCSSISDCVAGFMILHP